MNILIVTDFKALRMDGALYVGTQFSTIAKRYKEAFGSVSLCLRVSDTSEIPAGYECADTYIDEYMPVGGFVQLCSASFRNSIRCMIDKSTLVAVRCPSVIGLVVARMAKKCGKPYMTESMGDAWDAYWNHGALGKVTAPIFYYATKKCVADGNYALYVTERFLQERYPCKGLTASASNVLLKSVDEEVLKRKLASYGFTRPADRPITIMTTGAIDVAAKGQRFVIQAIPALNRNGIKVKYMIVGGGDKTKLETLANELDVADQVEIMGRQPLGKVFELLETVDVYIQPSLQEGLPRSVMEAMSKGCIVIGSTTAGTPELVPAECLVRRKSVSDIVDRVAYVNGLTAEECKAMSRRNFEKSKEYLSDVLDARRNEFYNKIKGDLI